MAMAARIVYVDVRIELAPNSDAFLHIRANGADNVKIEPPGRYGEMNVTAEDSAMLSRVLAAVSALIR
jgi:hypothetical protein